jgi:thiamine-monophosphate kinase
MDEFGRIAEIRRRLSVVPLRDVEIGIGDDAAVLSPSAGRDVLSVDAAVEGVHFRLDWAQPEDVGFRSLVAALSDLAAMGALPRAALCAIIAPPALDESVLYAIADGMAQASARYAAPVIGGNLATGDQLSITTTVVGECESDPLVRHGARPGDGLFITGNLGSAALGLAALTLGRRADAPQSVARWLRPEARIAEGRALRGVASAAIDVSDGLLQDLGHLCRASAVGAEVEVARLPRSVELNERALALGCDALALVLTGGEDYELLFTAAAQDVPGATRIGRIAEGSEVRLVDASGQEMAWSRSGGFRHF